VHSNAEKRLFLKVKTNKIDSLPVSETQGRIIRGGAMSDSWNKVFEICVGERTVSGYKYDDGEPYKIRTTNLFDQEGDVIVDEYGSTILPPISKGDSIELESDTFDKLYADLLHSGHFSEEEAGKIIEKF
jgi:hypothetical protein